MSKKQINYIILLIIFSIFFIYSFYVAYKRELIKNFQLDYIFSIGVFTDKSVSKINIVDVKALSQLNNSPLKLEISSLICSDRISPTFFYEPLYYSKFDGQPLKEVVQLRITQQENPLILSVYEKFSPFKKDVDIDKNALKVHIQKILEPYLNTSASCLGKMSIEFFERID